MNEPETSPKTTDIDPKLAAMLAYLLNIVGGIIFFVISKDPYVRFHSMQSIMFFAATAVVYIGLMILGFIMPLILFLGWIVYLGIFAIWIVLMIKAYQGERFKLPVIGDMAEKYSR